MADRLNLDDFEGHAGCRHGLEAEAQAAIRTWFTTPIGGTSPLNRLIAHLDTERPITGGWNATKVKRALASFIIDEPE
jgi:hypothetical protein